VLLGGGCERAQGVLQPDPHHGKLGVDDAVGFVPAGAQPFHLALHKRQPAVQVRYPLAVGDLGQGPGQVGIRVILLLGQLEIGLLGVLADGLHLHAGPADADGRGFVGRFGHGSPRMSSFGTFPRLTRKSNARGARIPGIRAEILVLPGQIRHPEAVTMFSRERTRTLLSAR
jgi:hypothetical protein